MGGLFMCSFCLQRTDICFVQLSLGTICIAMIPELVCLPDMRDGVIGDLHSADASISSAYGHIAVFVAVLNQLMHFHRSSI